MLLITSDHSSSLNFDAPQVVFLIEYTCFATSLHLEAYMNLWTVEWNEIKWIDGI